MIRVAGFEYTASLVKDVSEILALEDTTSLSYKHRVAEKLGKLGKTTDKARGWWVHSVMLLDSQSTRILGLIHQDWWCRPVLMNLSCFFYNLFSKAYIVDSVQWVSFAETSSDFVSLQV